MKRIESYKKAIFVPNSGINCFNYCIYSIIADMPVVRCLQKLSASCNFFVGVFGDTYNGVDRR